MPAKSVDNAFRLDGKRALVTGAGRGIGRAVALALAAAGAELVLVSRTASELDEVVDEIASGGGNARSLPFDVTQSDAVRDAFAGLERIDILVNNAGLNRPQPFLEVDEPTLDLMLGLNVRAAFVVAQTAARLMVARGSGVIINMSSQMGHVGSERDRTVYVMTKHALEGLTKAMAVELAPKGVRAVSIAPTFVETPLSKPFHKKVVIGVIDHHTLQIERPDQVAEIIREALKHIPPERMVISSDCGMGREGMSRRHAQYKMVAMVLGTNIVRKEMGLPESECLAADPRYSLAL